MFATNGYIQKPFKKACTMHSIKSTWLEAATLYAIRQQVHLAVSYSAIVSQINMAPLKKSQSVRLERFVGFPNI